MISEVDVVCKVSLHWDQSSLHMEGARFDGERLHVERGHYVDPGIAARELLAILLPDSGFEAVVFAEFVTDTSYLRLIGDVLSDAGVAQLRWYNEGLDSIARPACAIPVQMARRRSTRTIGCFDLSRADRSVVLIDPRGPSVQSEVSLAPLHEDGGASVFAGSVLASRQLNPLGELPVGTPSYWVAVGANVGRWAAQLAGQYELDRIIVPAFAGAANAVGLLLQDVYFRSSQRVRFGRMPPENRTAWLRQMFGRLMDESSEKAFRSGFDTDDMICRRLVLVGTDHHDGDWIEADSFSSSEDLIDRYLDVVRRRGVPIPDRSVVQITTAMVSAVVDAPKPRLPAVAESSTIVGAGRPAQTVVDGPGVMRACLTEIQVPAGWRATWEESGDVVLARK